MDIVYTRNHDEFYDILKQKTINNSCIIHYDSHHDSFRYHGKLTIANFLDLILIKNLAKKVIWVVPDHYWYSYKHYFKMYSQLKDLADAHLIKCDKNSIKLKLRGVEYIVCSLNDVYLHTEKYNLIIDIDLDFFVYNSPGFNCDNELHSLWIHPSIVCDTILKNITNIHLVNITTSEQGYFTPLELLYIQFEIGFRLNRTATNYTTHYIKVCDLIYSQKYNNIDFYIKKIPQGYNRGLLHYCIAINHINKNRNMAIDHLNKALSCGLDLSWCFHYFYNSNKNNYIEQYISFFLDNVNNPRVHLAIASYLINIKELDRAQFILDRLIDLEECDWVTYQLYAKILISRKRYIDAVCVFKKSLKELGNNDFHNINPNYISNDGNITIDHFDLYYYLGMISFLYRLPNAKFYLLMYEKIHPYNIKTEILLLLLDKSIFRLKKLISSVKIKIINLCEDLFTNIRNYIEARISFVRSK